MTKSDYLPPPPPQSSREMDKFILRMPVGMRDQIAKAAAKAGRSMNAEITHRLQSSFVTVIQETPAVEDIGAFKPMTPGQESMLLIGALGQMLRSANVLLKQVKERVGDVTGVELISVESDPAETQFFAREHEEEERAQRTSSTAKAAKKAPAKKRKR